jgi:hypothetical protein
MESRLAENGHADDEATGIQVDLDNPDSSKAVLRSRARTGIAGRKERSWAEERAETSKEVKKRMQRLQRTFDQQRADDQAAHQRQLAELSSKIDKLSSKGETVGTDEAAHQKAMDDMQAKLEDAQERGDSKEVAKLTREMSTLDAKFWAAQTAKQTGTQPRQEPKPNGAAAPNGEGAAASPTARKPTKAGVAWAKANSSWWDDTTDDLANDARQYANALHKRMLAEGDHDPETPEYFEIIGRQVAKRFPEVGVVSKAARQQRREEGPGDDDDDDDDEGTPVPPNRRAAASFPNRGPAPRGSDLQTLTRADVRLMREVNMDPNNDKHVVQFLNSKREDATAE